MSMKASSSQSNIGLNGSGALSHVYIQYPPLKCGIHGSRGLFYDDGNKMLISPTSDQVFSWKAVPFAPTIAPTCDSICEGPVLSIRYSLDGKLIAIQRSAHEIQFWHRESGETFSQSCKSESESILGFFWTDNPLFDVVFVKTSGLDLLAYNSESKSLQLVETKKLNVSWYVYTHESRLVLLASGMQCKTFNGFQLSSAGIIRLPKFEMAMAKSEANHKPVLAAEDVFIVTVYGRIYCLLVDKVAMLLRLYRFYRDAIVQQGSLPIYSSKVAVSVVDNVLFVHQVEPKVVILYDIYADVRAPISAPLPLLIRGFPRSNSSSMWIQKMDNDNPDVDILSGHQAIIYQDDWTFLVPDLICDVSNQFLWKVHLDLEAIAASSSDVPSVLEFLQRRKLDASKAKQLSLSIMRAAILEHRPVSVISMAIDVLMTSYSHSIKNGVSHKGIKPEKTLPSGMSHITDHRSSTDATPSGLTAHGKSTKYESTAGGNGESPCRSSMLPTLDSEEGSNFESMMNKSNGLDCADGKMDRKKLIGTEISNVGTESSSLQIQHLAPSSSTCANASDQQESQLTSPVISPDEMHSFVFAPVEEEMVGDPSYLVAIIIEFLRSVNLEKIRVHPNLYVQTIQLLAHSDRYTELGLFAVNKILEPSKEVALQLLESGRQNSQTRKLGLDMLRQLSLHHDYISFLVQDGYYLEALRYARKHESNKIVDACLSCIVRIHKSRELHAAVIRNKILKHFSGDNLEQNDESKGQVDTVRPSVFLEAAYSSNDSQHLAAVLRFFSDFIPGFQNTTEHNTYYNILNEMSSYDAV